MRWHQRFFWLLLVLLPTQLGLHFWPEWAGVLGRRVDYLAPTIYLTDILLFATLLFWGVESLNRIRKFELGITMIAKQILSFIIHNSKFVILFIMIAMVNIGIAQNHYVAIYKWIKVGEYVLLGLYIVRTKPKFSAIITPLSVGILCSSILAIIQFSLQHSVGGPLWWLGERTFGVDTPGIARASLCQWVNRSWIGCPELLRPYATFPHPNVLGGFLAAALPLVLVSAGQRVSGSMKKYFYISFYIGIIALLMTFSRSAVVVGGAAIILMIARRKQQGVSSKVLFFAFGIFFLSTINLLLTTNYSSESVIVRQQLNAAAIKLWQSAPLFGVGLGNFLVRLPEALPSRTIYFLQPVHNIYLLALSEVGIVGVGLIVLWIASRLNYEFGIRNYGKKNSKELFIIHTSLFIILLLGLVDHYSLTLQQGQLLLTILLGIVVSMRKSDQSETNPTNE